MFWQFTMWYLIVGECMLVAYALGLWITMIQRFGIDIAYDSIMNLYKIGDKIVYVPHTKIGWVAQWFASTVLWPARMNELPEKSDILWKLCEEKEKAATTETEKES